MRGFRQTVFRIVGGKITKAGQFLLSVPTGCHVGLAADDGAYQHPPSRHKVFI